MLRVAVTVLAERRVLAFIQGRVGPNRVGYFGVLQPFADFIKTMVKEDLVPDQSTRFVFLLAPMIAVITAIMAIAVYPFGPTITLPFINVPIQLVIARFDVGLLYVLGVTSIGVYGIALAGWSSNNKYSLMGGLRSSAQMISYELSLGLSLVGVVLMSGSLDLYTIVEQQSGWYGMNWNILINHRLVIYLISAICRNESRARLICLKRETELVAGFHTEYSSIKFCSSLTPNISTDHGFDAGHDPFRVDGTGRSLRNFQSWASFILPPRFCSSCFSIFGCAAHCHASGLIK